MRRFRILAAALIMLAACEFGIAQHDRLRAIREAGEILKLVYLNDSYTEAHERLAPEFRVKVRPSDLEKIAFDMETSRGRLRELEATGYTAVRGKSQFVVYLTGRNDLGPTYHKVTLFGDRNGYRVSGIFVQGGPFPKDLNQVDLRKSEPIN